MAVEKMLEGRKKWAQSKTEDKNKVKADKLKEKLKKLETTAPHGNPPQITAHIEDVEPLISSSEEEEEEVVKPIKIKKKPKKKKKVVVNNYYEDESTDEEEITNNYYKKKKKKKVSIKEESSEDELELPEDNIDLTQYYTQMEPDPRDNKYSNMRFV